MFDLFFKTLLKRLGLLLATYQLLRLAFYLANAATFADVPLARLALAFLHGLRFDLSAILTVNIPFLLLSFAPARYQRRAGYERLLRAVYFTVNLPFIFLNLVDTEYFKFIGRRSTNEATTITRDILDQAGSLLASYWYLMVAWVILLLTLWWLYPQPEPASPHPRRRAGQFLLLAVAVVLFIRGGIQYKPIRVSVAFEQEPPVLGNLTVNSTFTFVRSLNKTTLVRAHYYQTPSELLAALRFDPKKSLQPSGPAVRANVVIIILESFASEYTGMENNGRGYTPFFDSLATRGLFCRENYANGRRSIEALPSILSGLPSLMENPLMASAYQGNEIYGLGTVLKPHGYATSFYHGGTNGTMSFNVFTKLAGFDRYYGLNEYPAARQEEDYDGSWGIFDEPYLQYVAQQLSRQQPPFLSVVFTLSAHHPYALPASYQNTFPAGELPIHQTIRYTDFALRQFFKTAAQMPWYPNTLFVLTADHTQHVYRKSYQNRLGQHKVPLLFFRPGQDLKAINDRKITQHADILPTIVDYLNLPTDKLLPFGKSILDSSSAGQALLYLDGIYSLVRRDYVTELHPDGQLRLLKYQTPGATPPPDEPTAGKNHSGRELQAHVQYFRNALLDNNLYFWLHPGRSAPAP